MDRFLAVSEEIRYIEVENDVRIVYACDSEPNFGFDLPKNGDVDMFFVFLRPISDYLLLCEPYDRIERGKINGISASGIDLRLFLRLLKGSDPFSVDVLGRGTVFREDSRFWEVKRLQKSCFDPPSSARWHWVAAFEHFRAVQGADVVPIGRLLCSLRSLLAAKWCIREFCVPPERICELSRPFLDLRAHQDAVSLLGEVAGGDDFVPRSQFDGLLEWISASIDSVQREIGSFRHHETPDWAVFDQLFRSLASISDAIYDAHAENRHGNTPDSQFWAVGGSFFVPMGVAVYGDGPFLGVSMRRNRYLSSSTST